MTTKKALALIGIAAVLLLASAVFCGAAAAADTSGLPTSGNLASATYKLTDNVQLEGELVVPFGETATIDLNGHTIRAASGKRAIRVNFGGSLTLKDTSASGNGKLTGGGNGGGVHVEDGGTFNMSGGTITGGNAYIGGGVYVEISGTFNMSGGTITGNSALFSGGGVYVASSGRFNMSGGTIEGNSANGSSDEPGYGGGVYNNGTFTVQGNAAVIHNKEGGDVYNNSDFILNGDLTGYIVISNLGGTLSADDEGRAGVYRIINLKIPSSPKFGFLLDDIEIDWGDAPDGTTKLTLKDEESEYGSEWVFKDSTSIFTPSPTKKHAEFTGWYTAKTGGEKIINTDGTLVASSAYTSGGKWNSGASSLDLYAAWGGAAPATTDVEVSAWDELASAVSGWTDTETMRTVIVKNDISYPGTLGSNYEGISVRGKVTIKPASGQNVTLDAEKTGRLFKVLDGGDLTLTGDGAATLTLTGGVMDDTSQELNDGGAVYAASGAQLTLESGAVISGCKGTLYGGGVYNRGTFTMNGGSISKNNAKNGGGVYNRGTFTMNGGTILHNFANPDELVDISAGGGVCNWGTFTMNGGTISKNVAESWGGTNFGGGVFVADGGTFTMKGGKISENAADEGVDALGGGVYNSGTFTLEGGEISGNAASSGAHAGGGGVYNNSTFSVSGSPVIRGNTSNGAVNNVYLDRADMLILAGSLTEGADIRISEVGDSQIATGQQFGVVAEGVTEGAEHIANDAGTLCGTIDGSALKWTRMSVLITYHENGGTEGTAPEPLTCKAGDTVTVASQPAEMVREGYIFRGWNTKEDGMGQDYDSSQSFTIRENLDLYANWVKVPVYDILARTDGNGTVTSDPVRATAGTTITLTLIPEPGYEFDHWDFISPDGLVITNNQFTMPAENVEIKANFRQSAADSTENSDLTGAAVNSGDVFTVTYDANEGTGDVPVDSATYFDGAFVTVLSKPDGLVRDGYTFRSWNTEEDGSGQDYIGGDTFRTHSDTTLYADWQEEYLYDIMILTAGHGTVTTTPAQAAAGTRVLIHVTPDPGYRLVDGISPEGINPDDILEIDESAYTFTMPANHVKITAVFEEIPSPKPSKSSSSSQGTSIWLTAEPTATPTQAPAAEPTAVSTPEVPTVKPVQTQTPQAQSPVPVMGVLAGLGAAAVLFAVRRK